MAAPYCGTIHDNMIGNWDIAATAPYIYVRQWKSEFSGDGAVSVRVDIPGDRSEYIRSIVDAMTTGISAG
jgi:hypothetical protein